MIDQEREGRFEIEWTKRAAERAAGAAFERKIRGWSRAGARFERRK